MKILLVGYPGSKKIAPITSALIDKYLNGFEPEYFYHTGDIDSWSKACRRRVEDIEDKRLIFTLDDYWINRPIDSDRYEKALEKLTDKVKCVRLLGSEKDGIQDNYQVTAQYCIWDKNALLKILSQTTQPWDFEIRGTEIFKLCGYKTYGFREPIIHYSDCSVMSERHPGKVNVEGLGEEDIKLVLKYFKEEDLILGQKRGEPVQWVK